MPGMLFVCAVYVCAYLCCVCAYVCVFNWFIMKLVPSLLSVIFFLKLVNSLFS